MNTQGASDSARREESLRRGRWLEIFTVGWNVVEAVVAVVAGWLAGSIALVGFGFDSAIEVTAGAFVLRRIHSELEGASEEEVESQGETATRVVGITFLVLGAYIAYEAVSTLWMQDPPEQSTLGIVLAAASLVVMPFLAWRKLKVGRELSSPALVADSKETFVCSYMSFALLLGLGLNALLGWWWADPIAALLMVPLVAHEGWEAVRESSGGSDTG
jgi:cation diffusion facilitator family transporter